ELAQRRRQGGDQDDVSRGRDDRKGAVPWPIIKANAERSRAVRPTCLRERYAGNQAAIDAGAQLLEGMKAWIIASQPYRHGQEQEEPTDPPSDFVIAYLSSGATYLRWLVELCE